MDFDQLVDGWAGDIHNLQQLEVHLVRHWALHVHACRAVGRDDDPLSLLMAVARRLRWPTEPFLHSRPPHFVAKFLSSMSAYMDIGMQDHIGVAPLEAAVILAESAARASNSDVGQALHAWLLERVRRDPAAGALSEFSREVVVLWNDEIDAHTRIARALFLSASAYLDSAQCAKPAYPTKSRRDGLR